MMRRMGFSHPERVYGPTLMLHLCEAASKQGLRIGLLGGAPTVLHKLESNLKKRWSGLQVQYSCTPPYRPLQAKENQAMLDEIERVRAAYAVKYELPPRTPDSPPMRYWRVKTRGE